MKRILGAVAAGVVAFSGIYALAASLSVTSNSLGAGTVAVAACQSTAINAAYAPLAYTAGTGYTTTTVTVTGLASTCNNVPYRITLYQTGGASLAEATGTTPATGTTFTTSAFTAVSAAAVTGVAVVLGG
ncbi:MAG: hypothetical protein ABR977_02720 [Candidatus Dormibacteria bacterium]|jgi:hypothetical protein